MSHSASARLIAALTAALDRLDATLDAELAALSGSAAADLEAICRQKSRILLELTRLARTANEVAVPDELAKRLTEIRAKLDRDQTLLGVHLTAVEEVSEIIARTLRDAESDGTYSAPLAGVELRP